MNSLTKNILIVGAVLGAFALGWFGHRSQDNTGVQVREDSSKFKYINPLIYVDNSTTVYKELDPLKNEVQKYIDEAVGKGDVARVGYYYREMNSGKWIGVNADEKFVPGSILKVITMTEYLKLSEDNPNIFQTKFYYKKDPNDHQNYPPSEVLPDDYYTADVLMGHAIIESDNAAALALSIPQLGNIEEYYKVFRLPLPPDPVTDFMSARDVSRIFRTLYSSTYLLDDYSEQALELLTRTKFTQGLTQGLPAGVTAAHKFGEYTVYYPNNEKPPEYELSDCGIVYKDKNPYFVCIMTEGKNLKNMEKTIGDISRLTYNASK